jgi:hypothetical protein
MKLAKQCIQRVPEGLTYSGVEFSKIITAVYIS